MKRITYNKVVGYVSSFDGQWITAIVDGRWTQAKIYAEPSEYGVSQLFTDADQNGEFCRVSKLAIGKTKHRNPNTNFFDQMVFNYDRGLDFNELGDDELLVKIATWLDTFAQNHLKWDDENGLTVIQIY